MKASPAKVISVLLGLFALHATAATRYVNLNNPTPAAPFATWNTAATNIQAAIDGATPGDEVLVTNGVYRTGGGMYQWSSVTNRVVLDKPITVRSVNGPWVTSIEGSTLASAPMRCAAVTNGAVLTGFTLTNGLARSLQSEYGYTDTTGGGVFCESTSAVVSNCIIVGCVAQWDGAGAYSGTLNNCLIFGNTASGGGGGAQYSSLNNCTVAGNVASRAAGIEWAAARNCIVYYNYAAVRDDNYADATLDYCCTTPPPGSGTGNIATDPQFVDYAHISAASPCRGAGNFAFASGRDIDREAWLSPPSMGCDEFYSGSITGALSVAIQTAYTNVAVGFLVMFTGAVTGHASANVWDFGDGNTISNRLSVSHSWAGAGNFPVVFRAFNNSNPGGVSATVTVHVVSQPVYYVARSNITPVAPYTSWATAATNVQDAVNVATTAGALVLVTNGFYDTGGQSVNGASNRVAVTKPLVVQSVNGPATTIVDGGAAAGCFYLAGGAVLNGFTLTNGAAASIGGGVLSENASSVVSNCIIVGNSSGNYGGGAGYGTLFNCTLLSNFGPWGGGGAYSATLNNCILNGNSSYDNGGGATSCSLLNCSLATNNAFWGAGVNDCRATNCSLSYNAGIGGGGANGSTLVNCAVISNTAAWYGGGGMRESTAIRCTLAGNSADYGGGAENSRLDRCTFTGNWSSQGSAANSSFLTNSILHGNWSYDNGGGVAYSTVYNSALAANSATNNGGGAYQSTLFNCTLTLNSARIGGGVAACGLSNSICYYNTAQTTEPNYTGSSLSFCCTAPMPIGGVGNITSVPQLTDLAHISATSLCRGAGSAALVTGTDFDGEAWLNPPSIGCDEYYSGSITGALSAVVQASYTNVAVGFPIQFIGQVDGHASASRWDFADGTIVSNQPAVTHSWTAPGDYAVTLTAYNNSFPAGISTSLTVHVVAQPIHYVARNNATPLAPYTSWATAATNIQDAVDAASVIGALVSVTNGVYDAGGGDTAGNSNRVVVTLPLIVSSVNGPATTLISGGGVARGAYLSSGGALRGFTLTNGFTGANGAGVWCESSSVLVSNCVITANISYGDGGGVYRGTIRQCTISSNYADTWFGPHGGGAAMAVLSGCTLAGNSTAYGGGTYGCTLENSTLIGNSAPYGGGGALDSTLTGCNLVNNSSGSGGGAQSSVLNGCRLSGNSGGAGGGAFVTTLYNCTLTGNWAADVGGGALASTLFNCALNGNAATNAGGGVNASTLNNCTLVDNISLTGGGGASESALNNCILYYNTAPIAGNFLNSTQSSCCTTPLPTGAGNFTTEPQLVDPAHIAASSPCRGTGSPLLPSGTDIDGELWLNPPSIGCDEYVSGSITGALSVAIQTSYTNLATGYLLSLTAQISGHAATTRWDFGDGTVVSNLLHTTHAWSAGGDYAVVLRAYNETIPPGISATVNVHVVEQPVHYVSLTSANPVAPYFSWATAATNLQQAADVAYAGSTVLATNGVYQAGGRVMFGAMTNRLVVTTPVTVRSVNGPGVTVIRGNGAIGTNAVRCVYLDGGVTLSDFTIASGATRDDGDAPREQSGGGIWSSSLSAVVTNCVFTNNFANNEGGGVYGATLINCTFRGNASAYNGGGVSASVLNSCFLTSSNYAANAGGGASGGRVTNCTFTGNVAGVGGATYNNFVVGCQLTGNRAISDGGAAYGATFDRCYLSGNVAGGTAGAAIYSTLNNSALTGNSSSNSSGAVYDCSVTNCTIAGNRAVTSGGGAQSSRLYNSIVYYNLAVDGPNHRDCTLEYCCTTPLPSGGAGNSAQEPLLADFSHLNSGSPCRNTGNAAYVTGKDIDGEAWANPPAIGCDQYFSGAITGALSGATSASFTNVATGFTVYLQSQIAGHAAANRWDFGDGSVLSNRLYVTHNWATPGDYTVQFRVYNETYPSGVSTNLVIHVENPLHYVWANNPTPAPPYNSWATAANHIQDAVDVAFAGGTVLVSNGVYQVRVTAAGGANNRVAITKPLTVQSVNGPGVATISGDVGLRCVYLTNDATLAGFTLTGASGVGLGAGAYCEPLSALISNCIFTANAATDRGGGVYQGMINDSTFNANTAEEFGGAAFGSTLNHCALSGNSTPGSMSFNHHGGGAYSCTLNFCNLTGNSAYSGGGASDSTLNNCILSTNSAGYGGGAVSCGLYNCLLIGNTASPSGGAANISTLVNCTITGNSAGNGGGVFQCGLQNSILCFNSAGNGPDAIWSSLDSCWNADPLFVNAAVLDFHLQNNSPCINAGNNSYVQGSTDLDGNRRIVGATVDIGAYEFISAEAAAFNQWLQQYGLATDGSADFVDADADGMNNYGEWRADTNPTNALSVLRMVLATSSPAGAQVTWQSASTRNYWLERATNLAVAAPFQTVATNIPGVAGMKTFIDVEATNGSSYFYRVGVQ